MPSSKMKFNLERRDFGARACHVRRSFQICLGSKATALRRCYMSMRLLLAPLRPFKPSECRNIKYCLLRRSIYTQPSNLGPRLCFSMAPKQATLGYVKSSQTTLGCAAFLSRFHAARCNHSWNTADPSKATSSESPMDQNPPPNNQSSLLRQSQSLSLPSQVKKRKKRMRMDHQKTPSPQSSKKLPVM